jgi:DNA polymerase-3 subunit delta'
VIIGHQKQQNFLKRIVSSGNIPHALLFTGPEELGKKTIALELISSIFKDNLLNHPDFRLIEPETEQIKIAQIRELNWKLSLKPIKAPLFGAVIDKAHSMTLEAQNCFLKTLEEPKTKSLLILITEHLNRLLPTIISRCENLKFYPVKNEEINLYLEQRKVSKENIKEIIEFSLGRPGRAVDFLKNPEKLEERKKKIEKLKKISNSPFSFRFKYIKELSKEEDLRETLDIWLSYYRRNLIFTRNNENLLKIKSILDAIQETIFLISTTNVNSRLALEILIMKL